MGIEPGRIKLIWASAAEGMILAKEIETFVEEIRALGPLNWPKWDKPLPVESAVEKVVKEA
jgi:coenzyme F420-reducing hydrogenase delta subunit